MIGQMLFFIFARRFRREIRQKIERTIFPIGIQTTFRAGDESEQIRFVKTVQINDEIKFSAAHVRR